jgi:hypothetical protein
VVVGFEDFGYEVIRKGGEALRCHLMRGMEEAPAALRFDFIPTLEVGGARSSGSGMTEEGEGPGWAGLG